MTTPFLTLFLNDINRYTFIPQNVELFYERLGLMVIIAIGEILANISSNNLTSEAVGSMVLLVIQGFFFKFAYFDVFDCLGHHALKQASRISKHRGIVCVLNIMTLLWI